MLKTSNLTLKRKQFFTPREGNPGNVLLTSRVCLEYFYQCVSRVKLSRMPVVLSGQKYLSFHLYLIDTFQDIVIAEHMKPFMHILEISYLIQVDVRPTKTPKSAVKKIAQIY